MPFLIWDPCKRADLETEAEKKRVPVADDEVVDEYRFETFIVTTSTLSAARVLGLGAGGSIRQRIEPDTNDPRIWAVGNSRILNVQLLDSRSFRAVTGLAPPETPVSAATYSSLGLPFYRLWAEEIDEVDAGGGGGGANSTVLVGAVAAQQQKAYSERKPKGRSKFPESSASVSAPDEEWGLLETGAWGKKVLDRAATQNGNATRNVEESGSGESCDLTGERDVEFKIVLLAMDDTVPEFKSVVKRCSRDFESCRAMRRASWVGLANADGRSEES